MRWEIASPESGRVNKGGGIRSDGGGEGQTGWDGGPLGRRKGAGPLPAFSGEGSI